MTLHTQAAATEPAKASAKENKATQEKDLELIELAKDLRGRPQCDAYEDMISGMYFDVLDMDLLQTRHRARQSAYKFNNLDPNSGDLIQNFVKQTELLQNIVGKLGSGTMVEPPFVPDYGCNIIFGQNCFANFGLQILDTSLVIIGDRVLFGPSVKIITAGHETSVLSRLRFVEFARAVRIEDDCWIGANVTILPGVTIGRGCTVGAGAIVTKSIPAYSVAVGNPARVIKTVPTVEEEMADPSNPFRSMPERTLDLGL